MLNDLLLARRSVERMEPEHRFYVKGVTFEGRQVREGGREGSPQEGAGALNALDNSRGAACQEWRGAVGHGAVRAGAGVPRTWARCAPLQSRTACLLLPLWWAAA